MQAEGDDFSFSFGGDPDDMQFPSGQDTFLPGSQGIVIYM